MLCPGCRRLISSDEPKCPFCGLGNPGSPIRKSLSRFSLRDGDSLIQFIIYANAAIFVLALVLKPSEMGMSLNPFNLLSPSNTSLLLLGATGTIPIDFYHRWWTILTASSLHGGILHIAFNMMALHQLGPFVTHEYGTARFITIYVASGIAGFVLSYFVGIPFTLGASASVCGLIGAILYYGKSRGGSFGMAIYRQAMGWIIGLILFGLMLPGINNWAHGGGIAAGIAIGFALGYEDRRAETMPHRIIAAVCALVTAGAVLFTLIQAILIRFF
jgi:rhomboid protease GluP